MNSQDLFPAIQEWFTFPFSPIICTLTAFVTKCFNKQLLQKELISKHFLLIRIKRKVSQFCCPLLYTSKYVIPFSRFIPCSLFSNIDSNLLRYLKSKQIPQCAPPPMGLALFFNLEWI